MKGNEPQSSVLFNVLILLVSVTGVFIALCWSEYNRITAETYSRVAYSNQGSWTGIGVKPSTYYVCSIHLRGQDPQEVEFQALTYGWTKIPCPLCEELKAGTTSALTTKTKQ